MIIIKTFDKIKDLRRKFVSTKTVLACTFLFLIMGGIGSFYYIKNDIQTLKEQRLASFDDFTVLNNYGERAEIIDVATNDRFVIQIKEQYDRLPVPHNTYYKGKLYPSEFTLEDGRSYYVVR